NPSPQPQGEEETGDAEANPNEQLEEKEIPEEQGTHFIIQVLREEETEGISEPVAIGRVTIFTPQRRRKRKLILAREEEEEEETSPKIEEDATNKANPQKGKQPPTPLSLKNIQESGL
ncbi:hypothetical protein KI387_042822, partial [Taxus chinensis]